VQLRQQQIQRQKEVYIFNIQLKITKII